MLSSMEGNLHDLNERPFGPFVLDAESGFVLSTSPILHVSPWEIRPGPLEERPYPIHITT
jgi:hypothetical protein